jgi:p24 family protein alpha
MKCLFGLLVSICCVFQVQSLYFHIRETEKKCFIEELPDETLLVGKYKVQILDRETNTYQSTSPGIGMHVEVKDPEGNVVLSKVIKRIL